MHIRSKLNAFFSRAVTARNRDCISSGNSRIAGEEYLCEAAL